MMSRPQDAPSAGDTRPKSQLSILFVILLGEALLAGSGMMVAQELILPQAQARSVIREEMRSLELAIKSYQVEYLRLPSIDVVVKDATIDTATPDGLVLLKILLAKKLERNPRAIRFWEPPAADGKPHSVFHEDKGLVDPWDKQGFRVIMDYDQDGYVADPEGITARIKSPVLIYCAGEDGDFTTWQDNVKSWK
jgi:hypothetical protein